MMPVAPGPFPPYEADDASPPPGHSHSSHGHSKDSSSDTPSERASAGASSFTSLAFESESDPQQAAQSGQAAGHAFLPAAKAAELGGAPVPSDAHAQDHDHTHTHTHAPTHTHTRPESPPPSSAHTTTATTGLPPMPTSSPRKDESRDTAPLRGDASTRSTLSRSPSQPGARVRSASRRSSLHYVSGAPPPARTSIHISAEGHVMRSELTSPSGSATEQHPAWTRSRTGLSRAPSTSSNASASGRIGRSSSLRYTRSGANAGNGTGAGTAAGAGAGTGTVAESEYAQKKGTGDGTANDSPSLSTGRISILPRPPTTPKQESLLNPVREPAFEGDTLVSRSHNLLSDIAARERTLLDLKEEVQKQEAELVLLRKRWQQSVTSTLADDAPNTTSSDSPPALHASTSSPPRGNNEPTRQPTDTLRGWSGRLGGWFPKETGSSEHHPPGMSPSRSDASIESASTSKASHPEPSAAGSKEKQAKRTSIFGMMFSPPPIFSSETSPSKDSTSRSDPAEPRSHAATSTSESHARTTSVPVTGWFSRSWKAKNEPTAAPRPPPAPSSAPGKGPRIENGVVMDDVEEGQPVRIFLEELTEEDEDRSEDKASSPPSPVPTPPRDLPPLPPKREEVGAT